jgi:hypothetical protein
MKTSVRRYLAFVISLAVCPSVFAQPPSEPTPFPRFSVGVGGLGYIATNKDLRNYFFTENQVFIFGYQVDAEFLIVRNDKAAAYVMANLSQPQVSRSITETTVYWENPVSYDFTQYLQFRSAGVRFAFVDEIGRRGWVEGGAAYLKWTSKTDAPNTYTLSRHIHGWYVGVGHAKSFMPHISYYMRLSYTSVPEYYEYYDFNMGSTANSSRIEFGGWSAAFGLRLEH